MKNYDNFFLLADDLVKGREFYENILGLPVKFDFSGWGLAIIPRCRSYQRERDRNAI